MRPFFKTWLTICLLLPLAAHASNREQRLPAGFTGHTAKSETATTPLQIAQNQTPTTSKPQPTAKPATAAKQPSKSKTPSQARNTRHKAPLTAQASKGKHQTTAQVSKGRHQTVAHAAKPAATITLPEVADVEVQAPTQGNQPLRHGKQVDSLASAKHTAQQMSAKQSSEVLSRAVKVLGTPYAWGGTTPKKGFDCSGLVKYAFKDVHTVDLPRTSNAMAEGHGQKVARKDLKPGDLLFFNIESREVNHVAIYLGNDRFIHAPRSGKSVSIDTLDKPYWDEHYVVAKRVLPKQMQQPVLRLSQR